MKGLLDIALIAAVLAPAGVVRAADAPAPSPAPILQSAVPVEAAATSIDVLAPEPPPDSAAASAARNAPEPAGAPASAPAEPALAADGATASSAPLPCAQQKSRIAAIASASERRPDDAALHYYLAGAWAACGEVDVALRELDRAVALGDGFLPVPDLGFEQIWDDSRFRARRVALELALPEEANASVVATIPSPEMIPEGIAVDSANGRLFVGSTATGKIVEVNAEHEQSVFAGPAAGLDQVLGLAVDAGRHRLYAVSTNRIVPRPDAPPANKVFGFDLETGTRVRVLEAAGAGQLNDVTVAVDGTLFASDSRDGALYRAGPADTDLALWMPPDTFPGANGLAMSDDGKALYVAHATGIARVELATGDILARIGNATRETLAGIDGLYAANHRLYGIQNVTNPGRAIEIVLDDAGSAAADVRTLLSHHRAEMAEPTAGAIDGQHFFVLANSFFSRLRRDGTLRDPATIAAPVVLAVPLE